VGRTAKFTEDDVLDAALTVIAARGPAGATIAAIATQLQAPVGSIYHRFRSRDLLLAKLWLRSIMRFQAGFLAALAVEDDLAAVGVTAALHVVRWSREHLDEARVMVLYRREDLAARWPEELGDELARLNVATEAAVSHYARRRFGRTDAETVRRVVFALVDVPYAAARRSLLVGEAPPKSLDGLVRTAVHAVLDAAAG
jgi:AcrR family transcriptional regulator